MIVGEHKPIEEIIESVKEYTNVLVVGCQTCVAVSLTGGGQGCKNADRSALNCF